MSTTVQENWVGNRYVELDGIQYASDDLPSEGTEVEVNTYTGIDDSPWADISWSDDTPTGSCFARIRGN